MQIIVHDTREQAGEAAARHLAALVADLPAPVLGVATGSSPQPLYRALARLVGQGLVDLSAATAFALDEYVGLDRSHPESYASVVARDVTGPLGLRPAAVHVPAGDTDDPDAAAQAHEAAIGAAGGVDVQVLGLGANGHIGFNEPGSARDSTTRVVDLADDTRRANARFFPSLADVPARAVSQGVGTILRARHVVLVADGDAKAEAVARMVGGAPDAASPASFLQGHPSTVAFLDAAAARLLPSTRTQEARAPRPLPTTA